MIARRTRRSDRRLTGLPALSLAVVLAWPALTSPAMAQDGRPLPNPLAPKSTGPQPTLAPEEEGKPPPPPNTEEPMEEITVIAPRRTLPDFQTTEEFYRAEYERMRAEFEKPAKAPPREYEVFEAGGIAKSPTTRSALRGQIQTAPPIRDIFSDDPPKAEPDPP